MAGKILVYGVSLAAVLVLTGGSAQNQEAGTGARAARTPRNQAEFDQMFDKVSNWGRWGKEDRKSTRLNSSHIQKSRMPSSA